MRMHYFQLLLAFQMRRCVGVFLLVPRRFWELGQSWSGDIRPSSNGLSAFAEKRSHEVTLNTMADGYTSRGFGAPISKRRIRPRRPRSGGLCVISAVDAGKSRRNTVEKHRRVDYLGVGTFNGTSGISPFGSP